MQNYSGLLFGILSLITAVILAIKLSKAKKELEEKNKEVSQIRKTLEQLKKKAAPLWKYQPIADAQEKAYSIMTAARNGLEKTKQRATEILQTAKTNATEIRQEAKTKADAVKQKADDTISLATSQADQIITTAKDRAIQIAGNALEAKEKADTYAQKAKAMKNLIDGYGDEYLIAETTLLDELADEFSHKDAGVQLKNARLFSKKLVVSDRYATCDYVEQNRKTTAIHFVLDAFNGKVDTAISKIKHNNFGKLEQEIKDAYGLINGQGQAFRNARITDEYLAARLEELRWGVITRELQLQEREEQRAIKEAIREEEKARREYEKAIREAEKEERLLRKAMIEAKKQLEAASAEERQKFEDQITELQHKFDEAEAKNQRAISMAQQTKRGHVYVISNIGSFGEHVYKIGLTRRLEPMDRVKELGDASVPFRFDVHAMIYSENAPALENELHKHFEANRLNKVNFRKEFFHAKIADIRREIEGKGVEVHWTMAAEAREYRESHAVKMQNF